MGRKVVAGVIAGVLAAGLLLAVAGGAFQTGRRDSREVVVNRNVTEQVGDGGSSDGDSAEVVRVVEVDGGRRGWGGPGPLFLLVPLLLFGGLAFLLVRGGPRRHGWGPGPGGPGGPGGYGSLGGAPPGRGQDGTWQQGGVATMAPEHEPDPTGAATEPGSDAAPSA